MTVLLPYDDRLAGYDLGPSHPLRPERFTLSVDLMRSHGLLAEDRNDAGPSRALVARDFQPASREDLELVHSAVYIDTVVEASLDPDYFRPRRGLGPGDTPVSHGIHEAATLVCGATATAVREVAEGERRKAFSVAGGLHHAHRDSAAGFCVYNDPAVAIAVVTRDHPGLRVAYVDIDAHHGDGVEEAFYDRADVLTLSVHESGRYLFPGTGRVVDTGVGDGEGYAINVPLPPMADDTCYQLVLHQVIAPALAAYEPDLIVAQCGADGHHSDPLTHLGLTIPGHRDLVQGLIDVADSVCDGRIVCTGGGGYSTFSVVPRVWTLVLASLLGIELSEELPEEWRRRSQELSGEPAPEALTADPYHPLPVVSNQARAETASVVERVRQASPLLER